MNEQTQPEVAGEIVATLTKNQSEEIRFTLENYKGHNVVGARVWAKLADARFVPTRKGLTIDRSLYEPFMQGMYKVGVRLKEMQQNGSGQRH